MLDYLISKEIFSNDVWYSALGYSSSGYYNYKNNTQKRIERIELRKKDNELIGNYLIAIVNKLSFVPGKRTFRIMLFKDYNLSVGKKRIARIMKEMNLIANLPKRDYYKGQATHFHAACALKNYVSQDFYIAPRKVILTDITYLHYGDNRKLIYLCAFKDAFTCEILGYSLSKRMDVSLVKQAYDNMLNNIDNISKDTSVYIHSDQGSQYLSTSFKELLSSNNFIQSTSARGNSQDNAPMESFFSIFKREIGNLLIRCECKDVVTEIVRGYIDTYNNIRPQYNLANLTPTEFYQYCYSGIYPLDCYFGVSKDKLKSIDEIIEIRKRYAKERNDKIKSNSFNFKNPLDQIKKDYSIVSKYLRNYKDIKLDAEINIDYCNKLLEDINKALEFYNDSTTDIKEEIKNPLNWKFYDELSYVNNLSAIY